jgi:hypothetical protein
VTPGIVRLDARPEMLISRFSAAWVHDKAVERRARRVTWLTVGGALLTVALMLARLPVLWGPALAVTVACLFTAIRLHRLDIEDRKLQAVLRVLKVLRADIPRDQRVALTVDLRTFKAGQRVRNARVTHYRHEWLTLTTRLADGNTITLAANDRVKQKAKRKRTRTLAHSEVRIAVRFAKRYRPIGPIADALRGHAPGVGSPGPFTPGADDRSPAAERRLEACYRTRRLEGLTPSTTGWDGLATGDTLLATVRHVYGGVARARRSR